MPRPPSLPSAARALVLGSAALVTLLALPAGAASAIKPIKISFKPAGKTQIGAASSASQDPAFGFAVKSAGLPGVQMSMPFYGKPGTANAGQASQAFSLPGVPHLSVAEAATVVDGIVTGGSGFSGFNGLDNLEQASAGTGFYANTNFDLEPPDQGLAVGNKFVVEDVNNAIAVYQPNGKLVAGPTPMNQFFKLAPYAQPGFNPPFGPSLSDIRAYYDSYTKRFFIEEWGTVSDPGSGAPVSSFIALAVSDTPDPTKTFTLYFLNTTNLSATGVASFPDYTYLGLDANGVYFSSNYFALDTGQFQGVTLIALSKFDLEQGFGAFGYIYPIAPDSHPVSTFAFALAPSVTPPGTAYDTAAGGTEFFADSLDPFGTTDTRLDVWALTNTSSLDTFNGTPTLTDTIVTTEAYGFPVPATQKPGPYPLGMSFGEPEEKLNPDDDRLFQLDYANGKLWTANTTVYVQGQGVLGRVGDAAAYYVLKPTVTATGVLKASVAQQGYLVAKGEDLIYPTIAVQPALDNAVFSFTLSGPDYFPSAAYASLADGINTIHVAHLGAAPEDGFSGYPEFGGNGVARWGDYSAAVTSEDGAAWLATEYIPNLPRDTYANWGTYVSHVAP